MTSLLHLDLVSGIAGDMTLAALLDLGAELAPLQGALERMGLEGVEVELATETVSGIRCRRLLVHERRPRHHQHRRWADIRNLLGRAGLPARARETAERVFARLAEAEARVHGSGVEEVTFHEVGAVDSIADIVGCALALEQLGAELVTASPPPLGSGVVDSQHGPLPVPAPATLELLRGLPVRHLEVDAELTTPTGAALVAELARVGSWPEMTVERIGYGAGSRRLPGRPNLLRAVLGRAREEDGGEEILLEANIDDMNPEFHPYLLELLLAAGAHDVWLQPITMKKARPAVTLSVLCARGRLAELSGIIFRESTTIGLRYQRVERLKLERRREQVQTPWGAVTVKLAGEGGRIYTAAPEYEDCRRLARQHGVPLRRVYEAARQAWKRHHDD